MSEFHTTHYNIVDLLIKNDETLWGIVCDVHNKTKTSMTDWNVFSVEALTIRCATDVRICARPLYELNVYADAVLWAAKTGYRWYR